MGSKFNLLVLLCIAVSAAVASAKNDGPVKPGLKVHLSKGALNAIKNQALQVLQKEMPLPATVIRIDYKYMPIDITLAPVLNNITVDPTLTEITMAGNQINISTTGIQFNFTSDMDIECLLFNSTGKIDFGSYNNGFNFSVNFKELNTTDGTFIILNNATVSLPNIYVNITGDFFEEIMQFIASSVKSGLGAMINAQLATTIFPQLQAQINAFIKNNTWLLPVNEALGLNYNLTSHPVINSERLIIATDGTVYYAKEQYQRPPVPEPVDLPEFSADTHFGLQLTDYVLNSAFYSMNKAGLLKVDLPAANTSLNVSTFALLVPQILKVYKKEDKIDLKVEVPADFAPLLTTDSNGVALKAKVKVSVIVNTQSGKETALTLVPTVLGKVNLRCNGTHVTLEIMDVDLIDLTFEDVKIPEIDQEAIKATLTLILKSSGAIQPILDKLPIKLPLPEGLQLTDVAFNFHTGYIALSAKTKVTEAFWSILKGVETNGLFETVRNNIVDEAIQQSLKSSAEAVNLGSFLPEEMPPFAQLAFF